MKKFITIVAVIGMSLIALFIYLVMPSDQVLLALNGDGNKYNSKDKFRLEWDDSKMNALDGNNTQIDKGNLANGSNGGVDPTGAPPSWIWPVNSPGIPDTSQGEYRHVALPGWPGKDINSSGCGIMAMIMAVNFLEGKIDVTPETFITKYYETSYMASGGMSWTAPTKLSKKLGYEAKQLGDGHGTITDAVLESWKETFAKGGTVIGSIGGDSAPVTPTTWSHGGHIINIRGYDAVTDGYYVSHSGGRYGDDKAGGSCETAWPAELLKRDVKASWIMYNPNRKAYSLEGSGSSQGPVVVDPNKPYLSFKQGNKEWRYENLGGGTVSIGKWGCSLVTILMIASDAGLTTDNPSQANVRLTSVGGFGGGTGSSLNYGAVGNAYPGLVYYSEGGCTKNPIKHNLRTADGLEKVIKAINDKQSEGYYIDLHIDYKESGEGDHHVYVTSAGNGKIIIADPGTAGTDLVNNYRLTKNKLNTCCFRLYKKE